MDTPSGQVTTASGTVHTSGSAGPEGYFLFVLMLLMGVFVLVGNALTVTAIVTTPDLNTQANGYILHLAIADGIVGVAALWWAFKYVDLTRFAFDEFKYVCVSGYVLATIPTSQSLLTLSLMAFDRLIYVERPYLYMRRFTERLSKTFIACSWVVSIVYGILISLFHSDFSPENGCVVFNVFDSRVEKFAVPIPFLVIVCFTSACYVRIACIARHHRKRIHAEVRAAQIPQPNTALSSSSSTNRPAADRFKSAGLFVTINSIFALCWAPIVVYSLVRGVLPASERAAGFVTFVALSNSGMNFVIYAWKNRQFARAYKRLLGRCVCKQP